MIPNDFYLYALHSVTKGCLSPKNLEHSHQTSHLISPTAKMTHAFF